MSELKPKFEWIKPIAFLSGDPSGIKLIVELPNKQFAFLLPPYEYEEIIPRYLVDASLSKYGYKLVHSTKILTNRMELIGFLENINNSSE